MAFPCTIKAHSLQNLSSVCPCSDEAWSWDAVVVKSSVFAQSGSAAELSCSYNTHASQGFTLEWRYAAPGTPAVQAKRVSI